MSTRKLWRYDKRYFEEGDIMPVDSDHIHRLRVDEKKTELALRTAHPDGGRIRGENLYGWPDEAMAGEAWRFKQDQYLYTLEVDEGDVSFQSDVNHFTDVTTAATAEEGAEAADRYWSDAPIAPGRKPRREVLFVKGTVLKRRRGRDINQMNEPSKFNKLLAQKFAEESDKR